MLSIFFSLGWVESFWRDFLHRPRPCHIGLIEFGSEFDMATFIGLTYNQRMALGQPIQMACYPQTTILGICGKLFENNNIFFTGPLTNTSGFLHTYYKIFLFLLGVTCPAPPYGPRTARSDGRVLPIHQYGDVVNFKCLDFHSGNEGQLSITCQEDGTWSGSSLRCQRKSIDLLYVYTITYVHV